MARRGTPRERPELRLVHRDQGGLVLAQVVPGLGVVGVDLEDLLDHLQRAREVARARTAPSPPAIQTSTSVWRLAGGPGALGGTSGRRSDFSATASRSSPPVGLEHDGRRRGRPVVPGGGRGLVLQGREAARRTRRAAGRPRALPAARRHGSPGRGRRAPAPALRLARAAQVGARPRVRRVELAAPRGTRRARPRPRARERRPSIPPVEQLATTATAHFPSPAGAPRGQPLEELEGPLERLVDRAQLRDVPRVDGGATRASTPGRLLHRVLAEPASARAPPAPRARAPRSRR